MDNIGKGIMAGLEEMESNGVIEQKNISVKVKKSKGIKEQKIKRSFMLTEEEIDMVYMLKMKFKKEDYSEIVGKAIREYYKKCDNE